MRGVGIRHLEEGVSLHPAVSLIKEAVSLSGKERETSFETVVIRRKEHYQNTFIISSTHTTLFFLNSSNSILPRQLILKISFFLSVQYM